MDPYVTPGAAPKSATSEWGEFINGDFRSYLRPTFSSFPPFVC